MDSATALPECILVACPRRVPSGASVEDLFNPFDETAAEDRQEMTARLKLAAARSLAQSLGYEIEAAAGPEGTSVTVKLR